MATAKSMLAAAGNAAKKAAAVAKPAAKAAVNAMTVDPRTAAPRPANPFQTVVGGLLPAVRQTVGTAARALPLPQPAPTGALTGMGKILAGSSGAVQGVGPRQMPRSVPQMPGGTFDPSLDPSIKAYLDRQRMLSTMDAGVAYTFDPATQTFRGETMGGPVTMSLQDMQRAAAQDLGRQAGKPGLGGMLGLQGVGPRQMPSPLTQVLPDPMEVQRMQAEQAAMFARDLQMGRTGGMTQQAFDQQQADERQKYAQQLQAREMARQAVMPDYVSPYLGGPTGLGSAGPMQPPVGGMPDYVRPYLVNDMLRPGQVPNLGGPTGLGSAGPMQPPVGGTINPMTGLPEFKGGGPRFPGPMAGQAGMPDYVSPYLGGPRQMPQISGRLPNGAYAQQRPTTQAQPRPAAPSNYGGFNSIQGMGANQYGGFNTPPMPQQQFAQNQAGLGQMQNQQQFAQNQAGNMFGGFGAAAQPAQNQGPNQQAQAAGQAAAPLAGGLF